MQKPATMIAYLRTSGVAAAHEKMILHRDIKPSNIIIRPNGTVVVTDFGLAKSIDPKMTVQDLTYTGQIIGTPHFMPPEQLLGQTDIGATSDIYSLGAVLYFLLTGSPPFQEEIMAILTEKIRLEQPSSPRSLNPIVDRGLASICLNCLKKHPANRYQNVLELTEDVDRWMDGLPVRAKSVSTIDHVWHRAKRNRIAAALSASLLFLAIATLLATTFLWQRSESNLKLAQHQKQELLGTIHRLLDIDRNAERTNRDIQVRREMLMAITDAFNQLSPAEELESDLLKSSAVAFLKLGRLKSTAGEKKKSLASIEEAKRRFNLLVQRHPDDLSYKFDVFHCLLGQSKYQEAHDCILSILAIDDSNLDYRATLSGVYFHLGQEAFARKNFDKAMHYHQSGAEWTKRILQECQPEKFDFHSKNLAEHWWGMYKAEAVNGNFEQARLHLNKATEEFIRLCSRSPDTGLFAYYCVDCLLRQAAWDLVDDQVDSARQRLEQAHSFVVTYLGIHDSHPSPYHLYFDVLFHQAICAEKSGDNVMLAKKQLEMENFLENWKLKKVSARTRDICQARYWMNVKICRELNLAAANQLVNQIQQCPKLLRIKIAFLAGRLDDVLAVEAGSHALAKHYSVYHTAAAKLKQKAPQQERLAQELLYLQLLEQEDRLIAIAEGSTFYRWPFVAESFKAELRVCMENLNSDVFNQ